MSTRRPSSPKSESRETPNFLTLEDLSSRSQILFRITDPSSVSPLCWTGEPSTSGFGAPNLNLACLDQTTYHQIFHHLCTSTTSPRLSKSRSWWTDEPYIRHSILDHVRGREKQTCLNTLTCLDDRPDSPEDERSPWISTSGNLLWVVYDVVRRLVLLKRDTVYLTVISHPNTRGSDTALSSTPEPSPSPSPSSAATALHGARSHRERMGERNDGRQPETRKREQEQTTAAPYTKVIDEGEKKEKERGCEITVDPSSILHITHQKSRDLMLSVGMKENYGFARRASQLSGEVLVWGRIFGGSILHHLEFTREVSVGVSDELLSSSHLSPLTSHLLLITYYLSLLTITCHLSPSPPPWPPFPAISCSDSLSTLGYGFSDLTGRYERLGPVRDGDAIQTPIQHQN